MHKKEVRFRNLVGAAGKPEVVTPWADPRKDQAFMRAVRDNRVVTLIQQARSNKRDYGKIGFHEEPHAAYLVFPKRLSEREPYRVIGINYDLMAQPKVLLTPVRETSSPQPPRQKIKTELKEFTVIIERTASIEISVSVKTRTKEEAKDKALQQVHSEPLDASKAIVQNRIKSVE